MENIGQLQLEGQQDGLVLGSMATGYWLLANGVWLLASGYWLLATGYWLLATGYWLLATGYCSETQIT